MKRASALLTDLMLHKQIINDLLNMYVIDVDERGKSISPVGKQLKTVYIASRYAMIPTSVTCPDCRLEFGEDQCWKCPECYPVIKY
jgi:hypothetical protein